MVAAFLDATTNSSNSSTNASPLIWTGQVNPAPSGLFPFKRPPGPPPPAVSRTNGRIEPREEAFESFPGPLAEALLRCKD